MRVSLVEGFLVGEKQEKNKKKREQVNQTEEKGRNEGIDHLTTILALSQINYTMATSLIIHRAYPCPYLPDQTPPSTPNQALD